MSRKHFKRVVREMIMFVLQTAGVCIFLGGIITDKYITIDWTQCLVGALILLFLCRAYKWLFPRKRVKKGCHRNYHR